MSFLYDISVVIPCYNCSKFVDQTMKFLKRQNYDSSKIEIILINDGSTDNTIEILKKYESENIIVIDKKNEGVSATRNLGIQMSRGKYILFLDPDDYLSKNSVRDILIFFNKHYDEIDMVTYPIVFVYPSGRKKMHSRYQNDFSKTNKIYDLDVDYFLVQATINVCIKNRKEYQFDIHQFYSEDEQFNTKILMEKKKLGYVSSAIYYYRQHSNSVTSKKKSYDLEQVYKFHDEFLKKYGNHPYIQSIIMNNLRWRIKEKCLYPIKLSSQKIDVYLKGISTRLEKIDFNLFRDYIEESILLELLTLSKQTIRIQLNLDDTYTIIYRNNALLENVKSYNDIYFIELKNNCLKIKGKIISILFSNYDISLVTVILINDGKEKKQKVKLKETLNYKRGLEQEYECILDVENVKKINFQLLLNGKKNISVVTKNIEWCPKYKVLGKYQIKVMDGILITLKRKLTKITNKFRNCKNLKFQIINFLSLFYWKGRNATLYFGEKDTSIYHQYLADDGKKIFATNAKTLKYKFQLLTCKKLITDQALETVIPYGGMTKYYIQAGNFQVSEDNNSNTSCEG